jgi:thiamine biosynthesis lipoprotein
MKYFAILCSVIILISCAPKKENKYYFYEGPIQGTTFHITYEWNKDLAPQIDSLLNNFNKSLNNYDPNSTISKINKNETSQTDELFVEMFEASRLVYDKSNGAFDITLAPVINEWGFGWIKKSNENIPDSLKIVELLQFVGMDKISIVNGKVVKQYPETMLISNAIAQGLSVDYVADYFFKLGLENFLIEIGGEVYCFGLNSRGEDWKIGVDKPIEGSGYEDRENQIIINLSGKAIATSGNYRKYIENGNQKYGHSFDPRTGFPAENELLSVSVVSESCMMCDAWATAFMVCGLEESKKILRTLENIEAYFIYIDKDGNTQTYMTKGFEKFCEN